MLTLNTELQRLINQANPTNLVIYVRIDVSGSVYYEFVSNHGQTLGIPELVMGITPVNQKLDPWSRAAQAGDLSVRLRDDRAGFVRSICTGYRMKSKKVTVKWGFDTLDPATQFAPIGIYLIDDVLPEEGIITINCVDALSAAADQMVYVGRVSLHPLEWIEEIATAAGIDSGLIDSTSLDPSTYTAISHFAITRTNFKFSSDSTTRHYQRGRAMGSGKQSDDKRSAFTMIAELGQTVNGSVIPLEDGKISFLIYDETTAAVAHWTADDIISVQQKETYSNLVNKLTIGYNSNVFNDIQNISYGRLEHVVEDTTSQTNYAYPGASDRIIEEAISAEWCNSAAMLHTTITDSYTGDVVIGYGIMGFCGTNQFNAGVTQSAWCKGSSSPSRPIYLRIDNEIVKALFWKSGVGSGSVKTYDPTTDTTTNYTVYFSATIEITARAQLGTTAAAHTGWADLADTNIFKAGRVYDVTIPEYMARKRLERFSNGVGILEVETHLSAYKVQIGDFVTVTDPDFLAYGIDGLDNTVKWEVIGKEPDFESMVIKWTLAQVVTPATLDSSFWTKFSANAGISLAGGDSSVSLISPSYATVNGLEVSDGGGTDVSIASGFIYNGLGGTTFKDGVTITLGTNKTYDIVATSDGTVAAIDTSVIDVKPVLPSKGTVLAQVSTDASAITAIVTTGATPNTIMDGRIISAGTVATEQTAGDNTITLVRNGNFAHWWDRDL